MYSGTYALCNEIIYLFQKTINCYYLSRDYERDGAPFLVSSFDSSRNYMDDYNFRSEELPFFHRSLATGVFRDCVQQKADEWLSNRTSPLGCEFILFGARERRDVDQPADMYLAFRVTAERDSSLFKRARVAVEPVPFCTAIAIGEPSALAAIMSDQELKVRIHDSIPRADSNPGISDWSDVDASTMEGVTSRLVELVKAMQICAVGGDLLVASAQHGATPRLRKVISAI